MPALKSIRYERYAQALAKGKTSGDSYAIAGFKPNRRNASRLKTNKDIIERVQELAERSAERASITKERVLREIAAIALASPADAATWGPKGLKLHHSDTLDQDTLAAVAEISHTKQGKKIKMHSKTEALGKLARHFGLITDKIEITGKLSLEELVMSSYKLVPVKPATDE